MIFDLPLFIQFVAYLYIVMDDDEWGKDISPPDRSPLGQKPPPSKKVPDIRPPIQPTPDKNRYAGGTKIPVHSEG